MKKRCSTCKHDKDVAEFHKRSAAKDGLQGACKSCNRDQRKEYYKTARGRRNDFENAVNQRDRMKKFVREYLLCHPCIDCGEGDWVVLDFDHRDASDKFANISDMVRRGFARLRIEGEIEKCDVRCANCHRRRTAAQFGWL